MNILLYFFAKLVTIFRCNIKRKANLIIRKTLHFSFKDVTLFVESFKSTQFSLLVETFNRLELFPYLILLSSRYTIQSSAWFWGKLKFVDVDARLFNLTSKILPNLSSLQHEWNSIKKEKSSIFEESKICSLLLFHKLTGGWAGGCSKLLTLALKEQASNTSFKQAYLSIKLGCRHWILYYLWNNCLCILLRRTCLRIKELTI